MEPTCVRHIPPVLSVSIDSGGSRGEGSSQSPWHACDGPQRLPYVEPCGRRTFTPPLPPTRALGPAGCVSPRSSRLCSGDPPTVRATSAAGTRSGSNPSFLWISLSGAEVSNSRRLPLNLGDLRTLEADPSHQTFLAEDEGIDLVLGGRGRERSSCTGLHDDNTRPTPISQPSLLCRYASAASVMKNSA